MKYEIRKDGELINTVWNITGIIKTIGISKSYFYVINKNNKFEFKGSTYTIKNKMKDGQ